MLLTPSAVLSLRPCAPARSCAYHVPGAVPTAPCPFLTPGGPLVQQGPRLGTKGQAGLSPPGSDMEPGRGQAGEMGGGAIGNQVLGRCCSWKWVHAAHLGHCLGGGRCHRVLPELLWKTQ